MSWAIGVRFPAGPTQPPIKWVPRTFLEVKRPGHEADYWLPFR